MYNELLNICQKYYTVLELLWYVNGCWASKGFRFDSFFFWLLESQTYYDKEKGKKLYNQIKQEWCWVHDLEYMLRNPKILADFRLSFYVFKKLHWVSLWLRIFIFICIFLWLLVKWGQAYRDAPQITYWKLYDEVLKNNIVTEVWV